LVKIKQSFNINHKCMDKNVRHMINMQMLVASWKAVKFNMRVVMVIKRQKYQLNRKLIWKTLMCSLKTTARTKVKLHNQLEELMQLLKTLNTTKINLTAVAALKMLV